MTIAWRKTRLSSRFVPFLEIIPKPVWRSPISKISPRDESLDGSCGQEILGVDHGLLCAAFGMLASSAAYSSAEIVLKLTRLTAGTAVKCIKCIYQAGLSQ